MPATGTALSIEPLRQSETSAVAGMARSYGGVECLGQPIRLLDPPTPRPISRRHSRY